MGSNPLVRCGGEKGEGEEAASGVRSGGEREKVAQGGVSRWWGCREAKGRNKLLKRVSGFWVWGKGGKSFLGQDLIKKKSKFSCQLSLLF